MRLVSFDPLRTLGMPGVQHFKPEEWFRAQETVRQADWVLFPGYWQIGVLAWAWKKRIFPSVPSYHLGHDKVEMTRAFEAAFPRHTPRTLILANEPWAIEAVLDELPLPFVVKERRSSMGRGVQLIERAPDLRAWAQGREELYAQEYLPIHRDLRVVVVGDRVLAAYWREGHHGAFLHNVAQGGRVCWDGVPPEALDFTVSVARELGVDHAGFDVAWLDGFPFLLEFNVRFGTRGLIERGIHVHDAILAHLAGDGRPPVDPGRPVRVRAS